MNTQELYDAQLNISRLINDDVVNSLISRLSIIGPSHYNAESKCIDINMERLAMIDDDYMIRSIIKEWLFDDFNIDKKTYQILSNNIEFLFNIVKVGYPNIEKHIIQVYLY